MFEQDWAGVSAANEYMGYPMRKSFGLTGAGAGDHQQRPGKSLVLYGLTLLPIEFCKIIH